MGRETVIGASGIMGGMPSDTSTVMQTDGAAFWAPAAVIKEQFKVNDQWQNSLLQSLESHHNQLMYNRLCRRLHDLPQRTARWLLEANDHQALSTWKKPQHFLAQMLDAPFDQIDAWLAASQKAGILRCQRDRIIILSHERLEKMACRCWLHSKLRARYLYNRDFYLKNMANRKILRAVRKRWKDTQDGAVDD